MDDFVFRTKKTFRSVVSVEQTTSAVGVDSNRYVNFETNLPKKSTIIHFTGCVDRNRSRDLKKKNKKKKKLIVTKGNDHFYFLYFTFSFSPYYLFILSCPPFLFSSVRSGRIWNNTKSLAAHLLSFLGPLRGSEQSETVGHHASLSPCCSHVERVLLMGTHFYLTGLDRVRWGGGGNSKHSAA